MTVPGDEAAQVRGDAPPQRPEMVIALVGALGAPLDEVAEELGQRLEEAGYSHDVVRVSEEFGQLGDQEIAGELQGLEDLLNNDGDENARLVAAMNVGTSLRKTTGRGDTPALLAIAAIQRQRAAPSGEINAPRASHAYIIKSLKHRDEARLLRRTYGRHFVLVGVGMPRSERLDRLHQKMARTAGRPKTEQIRANAEARITIDEQEPGTRLEQDVRRTFPESDFFLNGKSLGTRTRDLDRLKRLLFGDPFVTPTKDEVGMFHAFAAGLRSSAMGRQVGASIVEPEFGDIVAVGLNEVPKALGGQYWEGDEPDARDFVVGYDTNDHQKETIVRQVLQVLRERGVEVPHEVGVKDGPLGETWLSNLTEFGRDVHAEMSALMAALRTGRPVVGSHLYCTTFPCHNCAKHLIAAGVSRVVFIEPYAKSFAREFHLDSVRVEGLSGAAAEPRVPFEPFTGVAPRAFVGWFEMVRSRKSAGGKKISWGARDSQPWFGGGDPGVLAREQEAVDILNDLLHERKISDLEE